MKTVGRLIAALFSIGFAVLAIPFLALTSVNLLGGGAVGSGTLVTYVVYAVGLVVVTLFWIRTVRTRHPPDRTEL